MHSYLHQYSNRQNFFENNEQIKFSEIFSLGLNTSTTCYYFLDQPVLSSCGVCQNVTNAQLLPGRYLIVVEAAVESSHVQRATCGHNAVSPPNYNSDHF